MINQNSKLNKRESGTHNMQPTTYLYLDTSEPEAVLAIFEILNSSRPRRVEKMRWEAGRELGITLDQKYQSLLKKTNTNQSDLSGIVVFAGPGSFTGLRIGISFANGLAFGLGVPIYETRVKEQIDLSNPKEIVVPFYGAPPKITKPKKK